MDYIEKDATIDGPNDEYRYRLTRVWSNNQRTAVFIMLNPSTADATLEDRTIKKCVNFSKSNGCGSLEVVNLFAFRTSDPSVLKQKLNERIDIVGSRNNTFILEAAKRAEIIIAAWGNSGKLNGRDEVVIDLLRRANLSGKLNYLKMTGMGCPSHPLYLNATEQAKPLNISPQH